MDFVIHKLPANKKVNNYPSFVVFFTKELKNSKYPQWFGTAYLLCYNNGCLIHTAKN